MSSLQGDMFADSNLIDRYSLIQPGKLSPLTRGICIYVSECVHVYNFLLIMLRGSEGPKGARCT